MAPGYRTTATNTRRGNRSGLAEHDDFEGLPVRQWREQLVTVAPPPEREENKKHDRWGVELPHGMPRDSHLLTPHNQELLRLARSGRLYKKRTFPEEDDADADGVPGDKQDKKDSAASEGYSFKVRKWVRLERSAEDAGVNHLAPRHKNTITRPSKQLGTQVTGPMVTKATVKRLDAAGNPYTQEVIVPDGQAVDGEIISTSVVPAPEATGEAALPVATPARRKPPIPQKKKGRGRGRGGRGRGRLPLAATPTRPVPQQDGSTEVKPETVGPDGVKIESEDASRAAGDIEMNESSALDDDDGDEGSGDDEEGDGDESGTPAAEGEDQEMRDAPALPPPESVVDAAPAISSTEAAQSGANLAPPPLVTDPVQLEGSPLKNVTLRSPTDTSPHLSPIAATAAASADAGLSQVPEPPAPVPTETATRGDVSMDGIIPTDTGFQGAGPEPIINPPIASSNGLEPASVLDSASIVEPAPIVEPTPVVEPPPVIEPVPAAEPPPPLEGPPAVETPPSVEPSAVVEPPPAVEPSPQVGELATAPPKEDVPLPSSEEPMPGQAAEGLEQQVAAATEPAPRSPIIAPAPAPAPSPPPVAQVPAEELLGDSGTGDFKVESGDAESVPAEGGSAADVVVEDMGTSDVGADKANGEDVGVKDLLTADDPPAVEAPVQDVGPEDVGPENVGPENVGTEDVVTEDGSFDILGSLSTSLDQQAEDDAPPPSLPARPAETVTSETAQPIQPNETAQPAQTGETGLGGQSGEKMETEHTEDTSETNKTGQTGQTDQTDQTSEIKEGDEPQTQDLPEKPQEEI